MLGILDSPRTIVPSAIRAYSVITWVVAGMISPRTLRILDRMPMLSRKICAAALRQRRQNQVTKVVTHDVLILLTGIPLLSKRYSIRFLSSVSDSASAISTARISPMAEYGTDAAAVRCFAAVIRNGDDR